jgi:hypothetical protein
MNGERIRRSGQARDRERPQSTGISEFVSLEVLSVAATVTKFCELSSTSIVVNVTPPSTVPTGLLRTRLICSDGSGLRLAGLRRRCPDRRIAGHPKSERFRRPA